MAGFFQQLIDLGEEKSSIIASATGHSDEEIGRMSRDDLVAEVRKLQTTVAEKENERKQVQEEALANQSKHEAYRKNVDMWQSQMKEMRASDKKMIDELRAAGATGKIDDAYVKSTNETIEGLKQSLKEARDDAAKGYKRQREAEEMRAEFEKSSKTEFQELFGKFDAFRERSKQSQGRLEQQVVALTDDNGSLRERLQLFNEQLKEQAMQHANQVTQLRAELSSTTTNTNQGISSSSDVDGGGGGELANLRAQLEAAEKQIVSLQQGGGTKGGNGGSWADDEEINLEGSTSSATVAANKASGKKSKSASNVNVVAAAVSSNDNGSSSAAIVAASNERIAALNATISDLNATITDLRNEVTTIKIQLTAAQAKEQDAEAKFRKAEDRLQRIEQDLEWEKVEADKKAAETKNNTDSHKAKLQQAEAKLEAKEEEMRAAERSHKRIIRDLEDAIAAEKEKYAQLLRKTEEKEQFLEEQIQQEKDRVAANSDKVGEAEETSKRTSEALESQRMHFEIQIAQRDTRIQELYGIRQALEAAMQEGKDDVRRLEDTIQELRQEISAKDDLLRAAEQSQSELQRALVSREEDLQSREKERQNLRTRLRDEEDRGIELQSVLRELELRLTEMDVENKRREAQKTFTDAEMIRLQNSLEALHESSHSQATLLQVKESQLADANRRIQDQGMRNADIVRLREDQISAIRAYEKKINDLEKQVAVAQSQANNLAMNSNGNGNGAGGGNAGGSISNNGPSSSAFGLDMPPLGAGGYMSQIERRQQMLSEAFASAKRTTGLGNLNAQQVRLLVVGAVVLIVFISIINGLRSLAAAGVGTTEFDSLSIVREKYSQTLQSLTHCQEQLAATGVKK